MMLEDVTLFMPGPQKQHVHVTHPSFNIMFSVKNLFLGFEFSKSFICFQHAHLTVCLVTIWVLENVILVRMGLL